MCVTLILLIIDNIKHEINEIKRDLFLFLFLFFNIINFRNLEKIVIGFNI